MDATVSSEMTDAIVVLTIHNERARNALSRSIILDLTQRLEHAMQDKACRAIVITGAGGTFCSGGDISGMTAERQLIDSRIWMKTAHRLIMQVINGEKPVIAAVEGFAFGAGLSLAAASDYMVVAENAKLCASFARIGLIPDLGLYYSLAQRVGVPRAKRMAALAEVVEGVQAKAIGLADSAVPAGATLDAAIEVAREYINVAPIPLALTKAVFANGAVSLEQALTAELDYQPLLFGTSDHRDAAKAFMEKRKPVFQGR